LEEFNIISAAFSKNLHRVQKFTNKIHHIHQGKKITKQIPYQFSGKKLSEKKKERNSRHRWSLKRTAKPCCSLSLQTDLVAITR
jgi:hypothetical protein